MGNLDTTRHLAEREHVSDMPIEVVVAVKQGEDITVYEGLADWLNVDYEDDGAFYADGSVFYRPSEGRFMTIHFYDSFRERDE